MTTLRHAGDVAEAQYLMSVFGLYNGRIDNATGPRTRAGLKRAQALVGLPENGVFSRELISRLQAEAVPNVLAQIEPRFVRGMEPLIPLERLEKYLPPVKAAFEKRGLFFRDIVLYGLATILVESNFEPVEEGKSRFNTELPDGRPFGKYDFREDLGNNAVGAGARFKGRGFIQITGKRNYKHFGEILGVDLINNPESALDPQIAAAITAEYLYINLGRTTFALARRRFADARRVVNGGTNGLEELTRYYRRGEQLIAD